MKKEFQKIRDTLSRLDKIQTSHIESFDTDLMPDLERQLIERKEEFSKLKRSVSRFITNAELNSDTDTESIIVFIERINTLLGQNKVLEAKVKAHREGLRESMKKISRGKQVIGSYGSPFSVSNRPRAINLTN